MAKVTGPGGPSNYADLPTDEELGYREITIDSGTPEGIHPLDLPEPNEGGGYSDEDDSEPATEEEELEMFGDPAEFEDLPDDLMPDYSDLGPAEPIGDEEDEEVASPQESSRPEIPTTLCNGFWKARCLNTQR